MHEHLFLLTHSYRDTGRGFEIALFATNSHGQPAKCIITSFRPLFFVPRDTPESLTRIAAERKPLRLRSMNGAPVDCLYFQRFDHCKRCAQELRAEGVRTCEADIHPVERYLMERMVCGGFTAEGESRLENGLLVYRNPRIRGAQVQVELKICSIDIETNGHTGELYSIACSGEFDAVFMIGDHIEAPHTIACANERALLDVFFAHIQSEDPDVLIGWSVIDFDLMTLQNRCEAASMPFAIGRDRGARILPAAGQGTRAIARIPGRVVLDGPQMLRANYRTFESYSLDYVAAELLGESKKITKTGREKIAEINRQFHFDKKALAVYNLQDARLVKKIFDRTEILSNAIERTKSSGQPLDRIGGSVAAFDYLYLPRLHRHGYVARNVLDTPSPGAPLTGGYVMDSRPGIFENVLVLDFRSLYPSIIMTFKIDPLGQIASGASVRGPAGPAFSRDTTILPNIIAELMLARARAKKNGNAPLSQAIKILMNSFYGVLGSTGCRFFSPELAQSITGIGQYLLKTTRGRIEQTTPYTVIYGDTDSLFVLLGPQNDTDAPAIGARIVASINTWLREHIATEYHADSALELEFETHFRYFFMPSLRGQTQGSKKRYCGAIEQDDGLRLVFKGMESARSDWTELAKEFQHELHLRVFTNKPVQDYIIDLVARMRAGQFDDKLVYRKGVRKSLEQYTVHVPPHIQAARMLDHQPSRVAYVMTTEGPQPIGKVSAPLDYDHYLETQLRPVADAILEWIRLDFDTIVSGQMDLFS